MTTARPTWLKVLIVSNYFPPFELGGYEQLCRDVAVGLRQRGHTVLVLTSSHGARQANDRGPLEIRRLLHIQPRFESCVPAPIQSFLTRRRLENRDRRTLRALIESFGPDVIFFWNLEGLPHELVTDSEQLSSISTACWLAGPSPATPDRYWRYWNDPPAHRGSLAPIKRAVARAALWQMRREGKPVRPQLRYAAAVSEFIRLRGLSDGSLPPETRIIRNGVELDRFVPKAPSPHSGALRLLFAGRLGPDKGVHTAIAALGEVVSRNPGLPISLTIVGRGPAPYVGSLRDLTARLGLSSHVAFRDWAQRSEMPAVMGEADVLVLPSIFPEALPRVLLEAMAIGLGIIATPVGGTAEVVEDDCTGLLFAPDDSHGLAQHMESLARNRQLLAALASRGQRLVRTRYGMSRMVDEIEDLLRDASTHRLSSQPDTVSAHRLPTTTSPAASGWPGTSESPSELNREDGARSDRFCEPSEALRPAQ